MNYDHAYHAGNPADVVKHAALAIVLGELAAKDAPIHYLETHAGAGAYALEDPAGEWTQGIGRLQSKTVRRRLPELQRWLERLAPEGEPYSHYLGSPAIAAALLRSQDALELYELHPRAAASLRERMRGDPRVTVHERDGYAGLSELRPRGKLLALVDPPFESGAEWERAERALLDAARSHPSATILFWHPIKAGPPHEGRPEALAERLESAESPGLRVELRPRGGLVAPKATNPRVRPGLSGTGLIALGAPPKAIARLGATLPELARAMSRDGAWELVLSGWVKG